MRVGYALCVLPVVCLTSLGSAPVADETAAQEAVPSAVEPFQPCPPQESVVQAQPRLSEPFYIGLEQPANESQVLEGRELKVRWCWGGPIEKVRLYYSYERCKLGGRSRGEAGRVIGGLMENVGEYLCKVPWLDAARLRLRIAGYDAQGERVATDEIGLFYRPKQLEGTLDTCVAIIKQRQRLYYYEDGKVRRMHIVSTAASSYSTPGMEPGSYDRRRGRMGQVFHKALAPRSRRYDCTMPYWMAITSTGSHGIHATSPNFYSRLGRPASHGCVRQHKADAAVLYRMVKVGTPVYVF